MEIIIILLITQFGLDFFLISKFRHQTSFISIEMNGVSKCVFFCWENQRKIVH